jgi:hypothetical protein
MQYSSFDFQEKRRKVINIHMYVHNVIPVKNVIQKSYHNILEENAKQGCFLIRFKDRYIFSLLA